MTSVEIGNIANRAIKLCSAEHQQQGVSSDEKWKNNKTVKQMNGNGKDKHVSIINKANNTKENKERILKKNINLLPPLTMLFDRWWSHFIFSSISEHIYLQHNAMDMIIAAPNKKCKALLYSTLFTSIRLLIVVLFHSWISWCRKKFSIVIVMCKKYQQQKKKSFVVVEISNIVRELSEREESYPSVRAQWQNWKSFSDKFWIMMMIFSIPILRHNAQTSSTAIFQKLCCIFW